MAQRFPVATQLGVDVVGATRGHLVAVVPDAHGPGDRSWGLYAGLADLARARGPVMTGHPEVTVGTLLGPAVATTCLTNHGPTRIEAELSWSGDVSDARVVGPTEQARLELEGSSGKIALAPYGSQIVVWEGERLSP